MTQQLITSSDDYREREPNRDNFENLPPTMQRRLFELMAAITGADQLYVPQEQPVVEQAPQPQEQIAPVVPIGQGRVIKDRKIISPAPTTPNLTDSNLDIDAIRAQVRAA
jgi:hypothetical protein